jgi:ribonucleoside-diphosphate reductase alpha chain
MISEVIKRDGSIEPFCSDKLNKWAKYASEVGGNWSDIAMQTFKRLTNPCKSEDIHQTMIDVCVDKKSLEYSRVASRLEFATIRKNMQYIFGMDDSASFRDLLEAYEDFGVWDSSCIPEYNPRWEKWYNEIKETRLEYWQIKQWNDKYACKIEDHVVETPHLGFMGIALALYGDNIKALKYAKALVTGKINLPTPALNGLRNGDWDTISCCVISGSDTVKSIGVANHIAYEMTAKKAGIGIEFTTRSIDNPVKGGRVKHLGKWPIFKTTDREVKTMTQITRGGNATVTVLCIDPEIEKILLWKSQRIDIETRIDKLDYSFGYNDAFVEAVVKKQPWHLFSLIHAPDLYEHLFYKGSVDAYNARVQELIASGVPHKTVDAMELLKTFLTVRSETGRFYDINLSRMNKHTPFIDIIRQSNLCLEIAIVSKGYINMQDLYSDKSEGETGFCSLSAINVAKVADDEYEEISALTLEAIDIMIERAPMLSESMKESITRRRSIGCGITGLAQKLYDSGYDYDGSEASLNFVQAIAEKHYFYLLKASQKLAKRDKTCVEGVDLNWLPIDTAINKPVTDLDWESLRGKPRKHSVLVAHMPCESSSALSGTTNGLYPVRSKIVTKASRKGKVQFICDSFVEGVHKPAWDIDNTTLSRYYARIQDFTDQAISCDFYVVPLRFDGGKVPMSQLIKEWVIHAKLGNKTRYYLNTKDSNGGTIQDQIVPEEIQEDDGCSSCKL